MNKITVKLGEDEWYPVIDISEYGEITVEISEELFEKYNRIMQEFNVLQKELYKLYSESKQCAKLCMNTR
jgi:hypothetical protein